MKSILLVTDIFPPEIGGPASFIARLGETAARRGIRVTVVCATPAAADDDRHYPFTVHRLSRRQFGFRSRTVARIARELVRHDACLVNGLEYLAAIAARLVRRPYAVKIVGDIIWEMARNYSLTSSTIDEFQTLPPPSVKLCRLAQRRHWYLNHASAVIVPSTYVHGLALGWGVPENRLRVIPNGIPLENYERYQPRQREPAAPLRVAFCGRLTNWKGVDTLLEAAAMVENLRLNIIGDGPERPALEQLAAARGIEDWVTFTGYLDPAATSRQLAEAHVLVLDSSYEGFSHVLLEAGAIGLALVASRCGGNPEIIRDADNGILVPPRDVLALRDALERLREDEPLRYRLASAAKAGSQRFAFTDTVAATLNLLQS